MGAKSGREWTGGGGSTNRGMHGWAMERAEGGKAGGINKKIKGEGGGFSAGWENSFSSAGFIIVSRSPHRRC